MIALTDKDLHNKLGPFTPGFRSVDSALRTIAGYEAMNMIRQGQVRWLAKGGYNRAVRFIERAFGIAA